jgi:hypothetical protein
VTDASGRPRPRCAAVGLSSMAATPGRPRGTEGFGPHPLPVTTDRANRTPTSPGDEHLPIGLTP